MLLLFVVPPLLKTGVISVYFRISRNVHFFHSHFRKSLSVYINRNDHDFNCNTFKKTPFTWLGMWLNKFTFGVIWTVFQLFSKLLCHFQYFGGFLLNFRNFWVFGFCKWKPGNHGNLFCFQVFLLTILLDSLFCMYFFILNSRWWNYFV